MDNVDNFVDRWVKLDILGRKLVKKGDEFQDIGVNLQKYNVDKMEATWGKPRNSLRRKFRVVDSVDNFSETVSLFHIRYKIRYKYSFHYIMPIIRAKDNLFFIDCAKINYIF